MAGAVVMVIVLVLVFPVLVMVGCGILAAMLGGALKQDSDMSNRTENGPNEYLQLSQREADIGYPRY